MKLKRLARQYRRLLQRWQTMPVTITLYDISDVLACSPRYARTLLTAMSEQGWLGWSAQPGRGNSGYLQCLLNENALHEIEHRQPVRETETSTSDFSASSASLPLHSGIKITFYRPLAAITPSLHTNWAERHLLRMVHAGLTRISDEGWVRPDLACAFEHSDDFCEWRFYIQPGLVWHNGEALHPAQIENFARDRLMPEIANIEQAELLGSSTLILRLKTPDTRLPSRLANPAYFLAHPEEGECGLGPYAIVSHSSETLHLRACEHYYGRKPVIEKIEYQATYQLPEKWTQIRIEDYTPAREMVSHASRNAVGILLLAFNMNRPGITPEQRALVNALASQSVAELQAENKLAASSEYFDIEDSKAPADFTVPLPESLSIAYFYTGESDLIVGRLEHKLKYYGCRLKSTAISPDRWYLERGWHEKDLGLAFFQPGHDMEFSVEDRFRNGTMIQTLVSSDIKARVEKFFAAAALSDNYKKHVNRAARLFLNSDGLQLLFSYRFSVQVSSALKNVQFTPEGWPDYSRMWIDESYTGPNVASVIQNQKQSRAYSFC
ncbi:HTH-type transcriptional regulator sgrR [Cedecea davisae]|uniref:ABC transporter, substrate-binding protein, family 5 n=1 Tax=Cedecea davisae DSM 4568 TaxID=566551 RepID=S3IYG8_9ENTR|nr:SgrR family transcriptional regulator [Cedecea davisae]EPF18010.1 ABC transporter, substrate-binding protein, family 5 [Cedecea davisae DSM 4568]SUX28312.1 HTH-type transcriptional regulator sgrR [Cedecea davisae]